MYHHSTESAIEERNMYDTGVVERSQPQLITWTCSSSGKETLQDGLRRKRMSYCFLLWEDENVWYAHMQQASFRGMLWCLLRPISRATNFPLPEVSRNICQIGHMRETGDTSEKEAQKTYFWYILGTGRVGVRSAEKWGEIGGNGGNKRKLGNNVRGLFHSHVVGI